MSRPPVINEELRKLYVDKLVQLKLKEELEKHYCKMFNKIVDLLGEITKAVTVKTEVQAKAIIKIEKLAKNLDDLRAYVLTGKSKTENSKEKAKTQNYMT